MHTLHTTPIAFKARANEVLCLDIYDCIGANLYGEGITASMVSEAIKSNPNLDITLNINSPGGDLFEGVAIYNVLKSSGRTVKVNVVGLAASAASLIAMAGDTITMQLGTQLMIHEALTVAAGFASDMRKMADTLDSVTASAADIYVARTGLSKEAVLILMAAETWMSPEDAVKQGFATSVSESKGITNSFDLSMFKHTPVELKANEAITCECDCDECGDGKCLDCSNVGCVAPNCMDCQQKVISNHFDLFRKQYELNKRK
jgi:ATP-dependent protease ClpP protease subunit